MRTPAACLLKHGFRFFTGELLAKIFQRFEPICVDLAFKHAIRRDRVGERDLLRPKFSGVPVDYLVQRWQLAINGATVIDDYSTAKRTLKWSLNNDASI